MHKTKETTKMRKIENPVEVMEILKNELPKCFRHGGKKLPLAIGIHENVLKFYQNDKRFGAVTLIKAFSLYCKGTRYLKSIVEGAPRIDIYGNPVSTVKKSEEEYALRILTARRRRKEEKEKNQQNKKLMKGPNASLLKVQKQDENGTEGEMSLS